MTDLTDSAVAILERLVSSNTVSDQSNLPLVDYVADYLAGHGVDAQAIQPNPNYQD